MYRGNGIHIRILERADLERTHRWINDPEIRDAIGLQYPRNMDSQQRWFDDLSPRRDKFVFAICLDETGTHIGNVALRDIDHIHGTALFSIFIADNDHRGSGHGPESARLILRFAFNDLNLNRVWLKTTAGSKQRNRFYRSLGFTEEGTLRRHEYHNGRYTDKTIFGMLRSEFINT